VREEWSATLRGPWLDPVEMSVYLACDVMVVLAASFDDESRPAMAQFENGCQTRSQLWSSSTTAPGSHSLRSIC
jgi:hypothetical protein